MTNSFDPPDDIADIVDESPLDRDHLYEDMFTRSGMSPDHPDMDAIRSVDRMFRTS